MLKAIHAQESCEAARRKAEDVIAKLRAMRLAKAAELVEAAIGETLAYYAFPEEHWRRIRTTDEIDKGNLRRRGLGDRIGLASRGTAKSHAREAKLPLDLGPGGAMMVRHGRPRGEEQGSRM